ncbi:LysE family transporter [Halalkalicoccus sp. NIPERK01]|uniref:LysE family transporter n=1 Tax=Halalkalicoccus sp. NIPERK01 TaxID=3053469 RepID=UPI00256EA564|nr:LysE family transporter [Halalkalicoccus sp. NIPERK01]
MLGAAVAGLLLGLSLAAPPGPMNAVIAEESVARGFRSGVSAGLGAMSADACFLGLAWVGAATVLRDAPRLQGAILGIGGLLLLAFAFDAVRDVRGFTDGSDSTDGRGFTKAFVLALTNPFQLLWWLTVGVALLDPGRVTVEFGPLATTIATGTPVIVLGFFAGIGLWITAFPLALIGIGRRIDGFAPLVAAASALVLAGFGLTFLYRAAGLL